jgi:hypothetical protein
VEPVAGFFLVMTTVFQSCVDMAVSGAALQVPTE